MRHVVGAFAIVLAAASAHAEVDATRATLRAHAVKLINRDRALYRLPPLQLDERASAAGDAYCEQQIRQGTTGHFTTDGFPPYVRYSLAGVTDAVRENAAAWSASYRFSERALYEMVSRSQDAMMAEMPPDDGHKRAILDPHATHVGIGLAWHRGEFRLVHQFIRRYISWSHELPTRARIGDVVTAKGRPIGGARIEGIAVHYESVPHPIAPHVASAIDEYQLPAVRDEYLPRLRSEYTRGANGTIEVTRRAYADGRRGDFPVANDGAFSFTVPFTRGAGIYSLVVWVKRPGADESFAATNVSIRVDAATPSSGTR